MRALHLLAGAAVRDAAVQPGRYGGTLVRPVSEPVTDSTVHDRRGPRMGPLLLVASYVVAGRLGLATAFVHASATAVWPPAGIALAGLLLLGRSAWPAVLAGAWLVNVWSGSPAALAAGIAVGNTAE